MQDRTSNRAIELRSAARTNLFLAATLTVADSSRPVKIRDLSERGARIETSLAMEVGTAVTLIRGGLSVQARIGWHAKRFCGLSFESPVSVQDWMANPINVEQRSKPTGVDLEPHGAAGNAESAAEEITRVSRWLGDFGQSLANDPQVVFKHGTQLFRLGLAVRALSALAETMHADILAARGNNHSASKASRAKLASQCSPM